MNVSSRALLFLFSLSLPALAQQNLVSKSNVEQAPAQMVPASHAADNRITLDVVVKDKAGKPISGLQQQDFAVLSDKKPQEIASFRAVTNATPANDPVKIILLVDEVNAGFQSVAFERDAVEKFLRQNDGRLAHPVSMIFFSDTGTEALNGSTRDGHALIAAFEQHETKLRTLRRSAGFYGAVDRFQLSITNLNSIAAREQSEPGRKILIWISPGWPYLSGPHINLSNREQRGLFNSVVSLNTSLRRARITLYSVDPLGTADSVGFRTIYYENFLKGVALPKDVQAGNLALQVIATQSGGRVLNSSNDLAGLIASAAAEADSYYTLTIDSPPSEHPDEYHALQVKTEHPGFITQTRTGYYADPSFPAQ